MRESRQRPALLLFCAVLMIAVPAAATAPPALITAPDQIPLDYFGNAIAVDDGFMVTGYAARYPSLKGRVFSVALAGAEPVVGPSFATNFFGDGLGSAVAIDGDLIVVGAPRRRNTTSSSDLMAGRIHLLKRAGDGTLSQIAFVQGPTAGAQLGASVGIDDGRIVAGLPGAQPAAAPPNEQWGQVRFYATDGATLTAGSVVDAPASPALRNFGQSVAISGEWAAASANLYRGSEPAAGWVALMRRQKSGAWLIDTKLTAPAPFAGDRFGLTLAMRGDVMAAGAPAPGQLGDASRGALFVYRNHEGVWTLEASLEAPAEKFCEGFGRSVAIGADMLAVGALANESDVDDTAAVFIFRRVVAGGKTLWIPAGARTGLASEDFGASLAFAGTRLAIGIPGAASQEGVATGAVALFDLEFADLNGDGLVDGADLAIVLGAWGPAQPGEIADINGDGVVDGADVAFILGSWS